MFYSIILTGILLQITDAGKGTVTVNGCVYCKGTELRNITVKMYDIDFLFDAFMGKTKTDNDGCFSLSGSAIDLRDEIDPVINFYHNCDMGIDYGRCLLKSRLLLDSAESVNTVKALNLSFIDVSTLPTEKDCIH